MPNGSGDTILNYRPVLVGTRGKRGTADIRPMVLALAPRQSLQNDRASFVGWRPQPSDPSDTKPGSGLRGVGASRGQPLFFVLGRAGIHRTETNARSKSCSRTGGGRTHGRVFWPLNADDSLIARSRQEDGERRVRWCSTVNHRANSHPDRNRSTILALTEDVRLCQFATNSWSAAPSRPISGRASVTMS